MNKNKEISNGIRIGIDARLWSQTGVGRYIRNLVKEFQEIDRKNSYILFVAKMDEPEIKKIIKNENWKIVIANSRWHSLSEQVSFPKIIEKEKVDLIHFPYFSIPLFYKKPYIITIHDLIHHHFLTGKSSTLPLWLYGFKMLAYRLVINNGARSAKKIIAVSNSTRDEIFDHLIVNKQKVEVVYEAADDFKIVGNEKAEFENYFLFVGNVYPHKNVDKLIKAFKMLSDKNESVKLVFVGKDDYFYQRLKKSVKKFGEKIIFVGEPDDKKLSSLYKNAIALVRPSLMEGFSLPPLEAMESRCLVIASDIPVHREIFEDGIIYFDPNNPLDIASKMSYAMHLSKNEKEEYIEKGIKRAKQFSWRKTAQRTLEIYESSLGL